MNPGCPHSPSSRTASTAASKLVKRQLHHGRLCRLVMVAVNVFRRRPRSDDDQATWCGTLEFNDGALINQAGRFVDLLAWLAGPVDGVSASSATLDKTSTWKEPPPCSSGGAAAPSAPWRTRC